MKAHIFMQFIMYVCNVSSWVVEHPHFTFTMDNDSLMIGTRREINKYCDMTRITGIDLSCMHFAFTNISTLQLKWKENALKSLSVPFVYWTCGDWLTELTEEVLIAFWIVMKTSVVLYMHEGK